MANNIAKPFDKSSITDRPSIQRFAFFVLAFNVLVILWGAYVRATGSGAGCGGSWPLCNGEVLPRTPEVETIIEFGHRVSSGLALLFVVWLFVWVYRRFPKGHPARFGAGFAMGFMAVETAIGAGLVLFDLVGGNTSLTRAIFGSVHLLNTFLLTASLLLCARMMERNKAEIKELDRLLWILNLFAIIGTLLLAVSGAVAALGDTLFPSRSFVEGLIKEISPGSHILIRLRVYHPGIAVVVGIILLALGLVLRTRIQDIKIDRLTYGLAGLVVVQWVAGVINVLLLAPTWMQLLHLSLAIVIWLVLILTIEHSALRPLNPSLVADR